MSNGLRLTEKWVQRGLWLVACAFAACLIGLGGIIIGNMWQAAPPASMEQFLDPVRGPAARAAVEAAKARVESLDESHTQAHRFKIEVHENATAAKEKFDNWVATRAATERPAQDAELIGRARELDQLKESEHKAMAADRIEEQKVEDAKRSVEHATSALQEIEWGAQQAADAVNLSQAKKVFLYRLAVTVPLLGMAAWLFVKKRRSTYWPFVWGFIFFSGFAFFFELVPYMPSYGGYVRYVTGIVVTCLLGRYAIVSLQRYIQRARAAETLPDEQRRQYLRYDSAVARLRKGVCPGCERGVDLKNEKVDFCPHCGIGLFDKCAHCVTRKSTFGRFCISCGTPAQITLAD